MIEPDPVTPQYDTWYGDEETFANYGGYDGEPNGLLDQTVDMVNNLTADQAEKIENAYWKSALGTTDLAARGYRSFWD